GSKHWTEEEKTELFRRLMGDGEDEHRNALNTAKNSCFRKVGSLPARKGEATSSFGWECAAEVFGGKKTYQAFKGCYECNFNLFKSVHAFETSHGRASNPPVNGVNESDRRREYERHLQLARKGGCGIDNISARTIDHWHRTGWYDLFCNR
ncbi:hypothetical protein EDD16DRAFT_1477679, partial [Pisolithus croceorrhizus]